MINETRYKRRPFMNRDRAFSYYDAYIKQVDYAYELACNLENSMASGDFGSRELVDALHTIENDADEVCHEIHRHLWADFIVPFERGNMAALANAIDDVSDAIEDIAIQAYCYHCASVESAGREMASLVVRATQSLKSAVELLRSHSVLSGELKRHLVEVRDIEKECDLIFIDAIHELYGRVTIDAEQKSIAHSVLTAVEKSSDALGSAAGRLEAIMVENV